MITALLAAGAAASFTLTSPDLSKAKPIGNKHVFNSFGCSGDNVSPALEWKGAPKAAKSFALTVYDPDAPTGSGWWHWVVYNIPAGTTKLDSGAGDAKGSGLPIGAVQGNTDFGAPGDTASAMVLLVATHRRPAAANRDRATIPAPEKQDLPAQCESFGRLAAVW